MGLTKKQQLFCVEFCKDPKAGKAEAAMRAGFAAKRAKVTACELMKNPEVQKEIERRLNAAIERGPRAEVTKETVLNELLDVIEACKEAGAGAWQMNARLKAAELLGKYLKMWTERVELGADDKLMEMLLEGRKRAGTLRPEELKADIARAQLPAPIVLEGEVVSG